MNEASFRSQPHGRPLLQQEGQGWLHFVFDGAFIIRPGMSNGGSAARWFASQRLAAFSGFYTFSPAPRLPLGASYGQLGQGKPCYQFSAQDDSIYPYAAVKATFEARPTQARLWELQAVAQGEHGFLYGPEGSALLRQTLARLCARP